MKVEADDLTVVISPPGTIIPKELAEQHSPLEPQLTALAVKRVEPDGQHHVLRGREINLPAALVELDNTPCVLELKTEVGPDETLTEDHVRKKLPNHPAIAVVIGPQGRGSISGITGLGKTTCTLYTLKGHDDVIKTNPNFVTTLEGGANP